MSKGVREALQYVADHPVPDTDVMLEIPVWELVGRNLFEIANSPDAAVRGSMVRATKAQRMIADRLVGTRRAGSHPAAAESAQVEYVDLTMGVLAI